MRDDDYRYLKTKDLAALLSVQAQTVTTWLKAKGMPGKRYSSGRYEFDVFEVYEWMDKMTKQRRKSYLKYKLLLNRYIHFDKDGHARLDTSYYEWRATIHPPHNFIFDKESGKYVERKDETS